MLRLAAATRSPSVTLASTRNIPPSRIRRQVRWRELEPLARAALFGVSPRDRRVSCLEA